MYVVDVADVTAAAAPIGFALLAEPIAIELLVVEPLVAEILAEI